MRRVDFFGKLDKTKRILELSPDKYPIFNDSSYWGIKEDGKKLDFMCPLEDVPRFDICVSSHVIEHIPDFVGHINSVSKICDDYYLAVPDKRFCFDHFHNLSNISEILEAHLEKRTKHSAKNLIAHHTLFTHNDVVRHWNGDHGSPNLSIESIKEALETVKKSEEGYIDCHAWKFVPELFRDFLYTLNQLGLINCNFWVSDNERNSCEFYVRIQFNNFKNF